MLFIEGWSLADEIAVVSDKDRHVAVNRFARSDVSQAVQAKDDAKLGFFAAVPAQSSSAVIETKLPEGYYFYQVIVPSVPKLSLQSLRIAIAFMGDLMCALPSLVMWVMTRNRSHLSRARDRLLPRAPRADRSIALDPDMLVPAGGAVEFPAEITIVLPVYNALDLLPKVLDRVRRHTDLPWHLIVIEDASSDPGVRPFLRDWVAEDHRQGNDRITLLENPENLGFIRSVNRAFACAASRSGPVVLLNSDAFVPERWASRLVAPIQADRGIATVTPMSNDAEIFSVPVICQKTNLQAGQGDKIDLAAQQIGPSANHAVSPTGVGFCMAINPTFLTALPEFDTGFGRGYGEEVDWCQRARAKGGRHVGIANLFVEHRGGESFGSAEKLALVARNNAVIAERYATYDREVQEFILTDPLASARLALAVAWAGSCGEGLTPVYLAHSLGGGAEDYLKRRIAKDIAEQGAAIVLRFGGRMRITIEVHSSGHITAGGTDELDLVAGLLRPVPAWHLIYSCIVGDPDPCGIAQFLLALFRPGQDEMDILFHDFLPLSRSYCLLNEIPSFDGPRPLRDLEGQPLDAAAWQAAWDPLLTAATRLIVFSLSSQAIVAGALQGQDVSIDLRPHDDVQIVPAITPKPGRPVVGVLGNIGLQKGAAVLQRLGAELNKAGAARLVIIGNVDPAYAPPDSVTVHGDYKIADLPALVAKYGINRWFIPSIWPETFSYTTHEALASGLTVYGFDLGGQADALRHNRNGRVLPLALVNDADGLVRALTSTSTVQLKEPKDAADE
ncbi:hypothetical protein BV911_12810 [Pseudoruegeria sp. SK021]|nr:hypothetical protein BV911_12810 [Pseudoruegeria sp. SK021]